MWNVWKQLFGDARHPSVANNIKGDGEFGFAVVGESNYQRELEQIVGGKSEDSCEEYVDALLVPEPTNPHDPSAVYVEIAGRKVGYLATHIAP